MEVLEDHLRESKRGSVENDLQKNFSEALVILTRWGVYRGHAGLRELNQKLQHDLPNANYTYRTKLAEGEMAFLEWSAESAQARVEDGADSYLIRDGRIIAQTVHYTLQKLA